MTGRVSDTFPPAGLLADRPADPGCVPGFYSAVDEGVVYRWDGSTWTVWALALPEGTTDGDVPIWDDTAGLWLPGEVPGGGGGGGAAGRVLLKTTTLASPAATVSFSGADIPSTGYSALVVEALARGSASALQDVNIAINGDTAANYTRWFRFANASAAGYGAGASRGCWQVEGTAYGNTSRPALLQLRLPDYLGTTWHKVLHASRRMAGEGELHTVIARANAAAVTSLDFTIASGNFVAGSVFRLYAEV